MSNGCALHDWVIKLPVQMQALLMTAMRGPDGCSKENSAKAIVRYLRGAICRPAGDWNGTNNNDFMWGEYVRINKDASSTPLFSIYGNDFLGNHDEYPHHFIMHLLHCAEVLGYKYPDVRIAHNWNWFYLKACKAFHMNPESEKEMNERLNDFGIFKF